MRGTGTNDTEKTFTPASEQGERQRALSKAQPESNRIVWEELCPAQPGEITVTRLSSKKLALDNLGTVSNS